MEDADTSSEDSNRISEIEAEAERESAASRLGSARRSKKSARSKNLSVRSSGQKKNSSVSPLISAAAKRTVKRN